jgi:hypothetical protein
MTATKRATTSAATVTPAADLRAAVEGAVCATPARSQWAARATPIIPRRAAA